MSFQREFVPGKATRPRHWVETEKPRPAEHRGRKPPKGRQDLHHPGESASGAAHCGLDGAAPPRGLLQAGAPCVLSARPGRAEGARLREQGGRSGGGRREHRGMTGDRLWAQEPAPENRAGGSRPPTGLPGSRVGGPFPGLLPSWAPCSPHVRLTPEVCF